MTYWIYKIKKKNEKYGQIIDINNFLLGNELLDLELQKKRKKKSCYFWKGKKVASSWFFENFQQKLKK